MADALGEVGTPAVLAALDKVVRSDASDDVVLEAVESIGEFPGDQAIRSFSASSRSIPPDG